MFGFVSSRKMFANKCNKNDNYGFITMLEDCFPSRNTQLKNNAKRFYIFMKSIKNCKEMFYEIRSEM